MTEVEKLREERASKNVAYIMFVSEYKKDILNTAYGFVEGKDDLSLYNTMIDNYIPSNTHIILYPVEGKDNVNAIYKLIDWSVYPKKQVVFFMDKDLSSYLPDLNIINDINVYVTDKYAIENDIISEYVLQNIITNVFGFSLLSQQDRNRISELYVKEKEKYENTFLLVMANIILWEKKGIKGSYKDINPRQFMSIKNCSISFSKYDRIIDNIYSKSKVDMSEHDIGEENLIIDDLKEKQLASTIIRGKYLIPFFIDFANSVLESHKILGIQPTKKNGKKLNDGDFFKICAPRCRLIPSLKVFIDNSINSYFTENGIT